MRPLEVLLLCAIAVALITPFVARQRVWPVALLTLVAAGAQIAIEGYRWQMLVPYCVAVAFCFVAAIHWLDPNQGPRGTRRFRIAWTVIALPLLVIGAAPPILVPIAGFPTPTGPHPVGTRVFHWVDKERPEIHTEEDDTDVRELMVQVWYPAADTSGERAKYIQEIDTVAPVLAWMMSLPEFVTTHIALMRSNAYLDAPVLTTEGTLPIIVFSHGNSGIRVQNTVQFEELASRGYTVWSLDHTYNAGITVFPDGRVVRYRRGGINFSVPSPENEAIHHRNIAFRVADISFVLDQIEHLHRGDVPGPFVGTLDLERVGMFGHSYGGGTTAQACMDEPRIKAGISFDGWAWGNGAQNDNITIPFMFMKVAPGPPPPDEWLASIGVTRAERDAHVQGHDADRRRLFEENPSDSYFVVIDGAEHFDFSDAPLLSPLMKHTPIVGSIPAERMIGMVTDYTVAFFETYINGRPADLLNGPPSHYPEITFERRAASGI